MRSLTQSLYKAVTIQFFSVLAIATERPIELFDGK